MRTIGQVTNNIDTLDKVTGGQGYVVNLKPPGMLHACLVRSPYPHARLVSIDTAAAEALPGVKAVLTPDEVQQKSTRPSISYRR